MRNPKDEKRAKDQDTSAEVAFAAGKLPEEDRRKAEAAIPPPSVLPPSRPLMPYSRPDDSKVGTYIALAVVGAMILGAVGFCR